MSVFSSAGFVNILEQSEIVIKEKKTISPAIASVMEAKMPQALQTRDYLA